MTDFKTSTILVTGASGHLGRRVVELLLEGGATRVIAGSRNPGKAAIPGAESRKVDFDDAASLDAAFAGVDQVLIVSTDVIGEVRQKLQTQAVAAAKRANVKHIVYTSLTNPGPNSPVVLAPDHRITEDAIVATGIDHTFLRNSVYTDMLLQSLPSALASGQWFTATGDGQIANVTREDCARIAAAVLLAGPSGKRIIDVTGPELLTTAQIAAIASDVLGKPINVVQLGDAQLAAGMVSAGLPPFVADLLVSFDKAIRIGTAKALTTEVADRTGKPAQSVREFLVANKQALVG